MARHLAYLVVYLAAVVLIVFGITDSVREHRLTAVSQATTDSIRAALHTEALHRMERACREKGGEMATVLHLGPACIERDSL